MVKETYKNSPNFLGSEVGLITKTITVAKTQITGVETINGRKIVKAGTIFTTPYKGLLFTDVDITDGDTTGSLMIAGRYIDEKLPVSASTNVTDFEKQGLYAIVEGAVTRPY